MINTIKAHISEIMWVKGHKDKAINFQILQELYYDRYSDPKFGPILLNVLIILKLCIIIYINQKMLNVVKI